jgi:hypothetical protein
MSGRRHVPTSGTHRTRSWVGLRAGLDTEIEEIFFRLCRGLNHDRPVIQPIARHCNDWATRLTENCIGKSKYIKYNWGLSGCSAVDSTRWRAGRELWGELIGTPSRNCVVCCSLLKGMRYTERTKGKKFVWADATILRILLSFWSKEKHLCHYLFQTLSFLSFVFFWQVS